MKGSATPFLKGGERTRRPLDAFFSLGQHSLFVVVLETLQPTEYLMHFLDDIYLFSQPERTGIAHRELGHQLWTRAGISLHWGWPMPTRFVKAFL